MTTSLHENPAPRAVRAGIATAEHHRAVVPPIHLSSTFPFDGFDRKRRYDYTRSGNPTRDHLADALSELEEGCGGVITSSGMSAVTLALQLVPPGGKVLAAHDCYGGTYRLLRALAARGQIQLELADLTAAEAVDRVLAARPALLWVETPSNPLRRITDLRSVAEAGHRVGAVVVADNTFLSPALQRPLTLGADVVVHSTTKYLNGHSDVVGGAVIARDPAQLETLAWWGNCLGLTGSPFDSFLTLRGVRTLFARMRLHEENAHLVAQALESHAAVLAVHYPGLESHPGHSLASGQQSGFGGMVSFVVRGGAPAVDQLTDSLRCFTLAESLGGVESLVAHPATMTHASMDADARRVAGIGDGLVRLSVGIEDGRELVADLTAALDALLPEDEAVSGDSSGVRTAKLEVPAVS
jgi:cystathionine gamma-synthase